MTAMYRIDLTDGVLSFDHYPAPRVADTCGAPNAKQYFASRGKKKPAPVRVRGWPFKAFYLTQGDEENGLAVAWA
jgi:hypothetical protein